MEFSSKKTENCFANAQTYAYGLPLKGEALLPLLAAAGWDCRTNTKLRRPVFVAEREGITLKGVLADAQIRASFPEADWAAEKAAFELWLEGLKG